ncbi:MAG: FixH family protein [Pseudoxanthomonas sp.]
MNANTPRRSPWREPMLWLVLGLPLASIFAGVGLVITAVRSGGADAVGDEVKRVSQIQTTDLGPDEAARRNGLVAVLRIDDGAVEVLPASDGFDHAEALQATFAHPLHASADRVLRLHPSGNGWRVETDIALDHDWRIQLSPEDGEWRLRGRLPRQQHAARLAPALDE